MMNCKEFVKSEYIYDLLNIHHNIVYDGLCPDAFLIGLGFGTYHRNFRMGSCMRFSIKFYPRYRHLCKSNFGLTILV